VRPLIGITCEREPARWDVWNAEADLLPATYADMVIEGGGCPVLIPPRKGLASDLVGRLDGLVLSGGPDVAPSRYGEGAHESVLEVREERDELELSLLAAFLAWRRPVLAVCRGAQLLNVCRGGTLVQHLPDVIGRSHREEGTASMQHHVRLTKGSKIEGILGPVVEAQCSHHQAVRELGAGLHEVGRADDGVIEALELTDHPFVIGVQWHPEDSADARLFAALVTAAAGVAATAAGRAARQGLGSDDGPA
jgi:putative glutamine amidotransferase